MSRRRTRILTIGLPLAALVVAIVLVRARPNPPRSPAPPRVPSVTAEPIEAGTGALPVEGSGTVRPRAEVDLAPRVSAQVVWVSPNLVSGGRFRAGEVLVRLDDADFRNAVEQARAQVAQDSVALLQAEEEARIAADEYRRFQRREGVDTPPSPLVLREPQLQAARAALARALAQLADAELALSRTRLQAPFDGVVRSEIVDPGAYATVGQSLARVYSSDAVEVIVPVTDGDAAMIPGLWDVSRDRTVAATVLAEYGGRRYRWAGHVDRVEAALDEQSRTIDLVVRVEDPFRPGSPADSHDSSVSEGAPPLLVGQFVDVRVEGRSGPHYILPRRGLRPGNEVWAVADSAVRIVPVRVLQQMQDSVFVLGDFRPGEEVITAGVNLATDGMKVRVESRGN